MQKGEIHILTGPINSGKTTLLLEWTKRWKAAGILTPRSNNGRLFYDIQTGQTFPMEASENEAAIPVGKFRFSKKSFEEAIQIIRKAADNADTDWLIIDEIGPLELREEGFFEILKTILQEEKKIRLLLVIRDKSIQEVVLKLNMRKINVINI